MTTCNICKTSWTANVVSCPVCPTKTLDELISDCGLGFRSLSLHSDGRWIAKAGHRALPTKQLFTEKTAKDAVIKLFRALYPVEPQS